MSTPYTKELPFKGQDVPNEQRYVIKLTLQALPIKEMERILTTKHPSLREEQTLSAMLGQCQKAGTEASQGTPTEA